MSKFIAAQLRGKEKIMNLKNEFKDDLKYTSLGFFCAIVILASGSFIWSVIFIFTHSFENAAFVFFVSVIGIVVLTTIGFIYYILVMLLIYGIKNHETSAKTIGTLFDKFLNEEKVNVSDYVHSHETNEKLDIIPCNLSFISEVFCKKHCQIETICRKHHKYIYKLVEFCYNRCNL